MTCATWSVRLALVVLGCSVAATLAPATAGADNRIVDCAGGRRLAAALRLPSGRQLTVMVRGTCNESVTITRDDVTLRGESPAAGSGVNGTIVIDGARRVLVENLTISGPGIGIHGIHGAAFTVRSSVIQDTVGAGVVLQGARATIDANTVQRTGGAGVNLDNAEAIITGNTIDAIRGAGIQVTNASAAKIGLTEAGTPAGNAIRNGTGNGVMITNGSVALLRSNTVELNAGAGVFTVRSLVTLQGGNLIQSNGGNGIFVGQGQLAGRPGALRDTVTGNGTGSGGGRGLKVDVGGLASVWAMDITNHVHGDGVGVFASSLDIERSTVSGNSGGDGIQAFNGARIDVLDSTVTGNGRDGIRLNLNSSLYIRNSGATATTAVSGNAGNGIGVFWGSGVNMSTENGGAPVSVTGNASGIAESYGVLCSASKFYGNASAVTGNARDILPSPLDALGTECGPLVVPVPVPPPAD